MPSSLAALHLPPPYARQVDFTQREAPLSTLFGSDKLFADNLSAFGDKDGFARNVRLQFPAALCPLRCRLSATHPPPTLIDPVLRWTGHMYTH